MALRGAAFGISLALLGAAHAQGYEPKLGVYLCTVGQTAGIGTIHLENAPPPKAYALQHDGVRFRIGISLIANWTTASSPRYQITELDYEGPGKDRAVWHTDHAVLHSAYVGGGREFTASEDQGFLRIGPADDTGSTVWFWHAGFQYAGGEDVGLAVRLGECQHER